MRKLDDVIAKYERLEVNLGLAGATGQIDLGLVIKDLKELEFSIKREQQLQYEAGYKAGELQGRQDGYWDGWEAAKEQISKENT